MHYTLQVFETADGFDARTDPARQASYWQGTMAYLQALKEAGIFVSGAGLQPPSAATTLRRNQGQLVVQDGRTTYTDQPCPKGAQELPVDGAVTSLPRPQY